MSTADIHYDPLEYSDRYHIHTAKNSIESLSHVVEEIASNEDEAIARRAVRDGGEDSGSISFAYDPDTQELSVTGDGDGMDAETMRSRLRRVGESTQADSRRGFFHRGVREVFVAMGGGEIISIGRDAAGAEVLSHVRFHPIKGMAFLREDEAPTEADRAELGLPGTGTRVEVSMRRFARRRPRDYEFNRMETQIRNCVGLRPVLTDPKRTLTLAYGDAPRRELRFAYPEREPLVALRDVTISGQHGTFWADLAAEPVAGGGNSKRTRAYGILVRGERAAYEVSLGDRARGNPAMHRVVGELRLDGIEQLQRDADARGDDEAQLIYKPDRSGLNREHPLVEAIHTFVDDTVGPLIANVVTEAKKPVSPDMRRQLARLVREINQVIKEEFASVEDPGGDPDQDPDRPEDEQPPPPGPFDPVPRVVEDGIAFARSRIFIEAGQQRTVKVWFDIEKVPEEAQAVLALVGEGPVRRADLSDDRVPPAGADGIAELRLAITAGNVEGRQELTVTAGGYSATLPVHVRYPRASGFISNIVFDPEDWETGSARWDSSTGVVTVYVGRPEFRDAAARAVREGVADPEKHPLYRQLVVESVREAALWEAAQRKAEVDWDDLPFEERQEQGSFFRLVQFTFQELDYQLRAKLLRVFVEA